MKKYLLALLFIPIMGLNFATAQLASTSKVIFSDTLIKLISDPNFKYETNPNNAMKRCLQPAEMVWYYEILLTKYSSDSSAISFINKQLKFSKSKLHK
jgi:hypothetical protein